MIAAVPNVEPLLDVKQVADLLNVSTRHVYRLTDGGLMPKQLKPGAVNRWLRHKIDEWLFSEMPNTASLSLGRIVLIVVPSNCDATTVTQRLPHQEAVRKQKAR